MALKTVGLRAFLQFMSFFASTLLCKLRVKSVSFLLRGLTAAFFSGVISCLSSFTAPTSAFCSLAFWLALASRSLVCQTWGLQRSPCRFPHGQLLHRFNLSACVSSPQMLRPPVYLLLPTPPPSLSHQRFLHGPSGYEKCSYLLMFCPTRTYRGTSRERVCYGCFPCTWHCLVLSGIW